MKATTRLRFLHLVCLLLGLLSLIPNLWAQNETVGLRPNHLFESGQFGEGIDILNGRLTCNGRGKGAERGDR